MYAYRLGSEKEEWRNESPVFSDKNTNEYKSEIIIAGYARETDDIECIDQTKYHYLDHGVKFCCLWNLPLGYLAEDGLETSHQIYNILRRQYLNQRGKKRVEHMMGKMYLITAPIYYGKYTTQKKA